MCEKVSVCGEQVILCLEHQLWQKNRATETAQEVTGEETSDAAIDRDCRQHVSLSLRVAWQVPSDWV